MTKPIQNFIVGVRHGGDTRYTTETILVGAKTPEEAIKTAKEGYKKHYRYTCNRAEKNPEKILKQGQIEYLYPKNLRGERLTYHPMRRRENRKNVE